MDMNPALAVNRESRTDLHLLDIFEHGEELLNLILKYFRLDDHTASSDFVIDGSKDVIFEKAVELQEKFIRATSKQKKARAAAEALYEVACIDEDNEQHAHAFEVLCMADTTTRVSEDKHLLAKVLKKRATNAQRLGNYELACLLWEEHSEVLVLAHKEDVVASSRQAVTLPPNGNKNNATGTEAAALKEVLDALPFGVVYYSRTLVYPVVNSYVLDLLGISLTEFVGQDGSSWTHPDDFAIERAFQKELFQGKRTSFSVKQRLFPPKKPNCEVQLDSHSLRNDDGEVYAVITLLKTVEKNSSFVMYNE